MKLKLLCVVAASALFVVFGFMTEKASALNQTFYIDCSQPVDGDGSLGNPWNTPQSLYDHQRPPGPYSLGGGDQILLMRGTTCTYPVRLIRGQGTSGSPILVSTYGDPSDPRPIINGSGVEVDNWDGESDSSAVQVYDADNLIIEDLELTNTGGNELDGRRQGIQIFAVERYGVHENIIIRDNYIHDIEGEYKKNHEATAGILVEQRLPPVGLDPNPLVTWFDNVTIEDNIIENTNRQGINLWGDWRNRDEDGYDPTGPAWTAWTNFTIQRNTIKHVRGDGILISNTDGADINNNTVEGFNELNALSEAEILSIRQDAQTKQSLGSLPSRRHAGIWTYNADNTVIEHNDVRGGVSNEDGMAYDIDGGSIGTTIQYNYSQDNDGGWLLICNEIGEIRDGIVRYNISKNDGFASITTCVGEILTTQIYNNTVYNTETVDYPWRQVDWLRFVGDPMNDVRDIDLTNNIFSYPGQDIEYFFYNEREGLGILADTVAPDTDADTNLFYGVASPGLDASAVVDRPRFRDISLEAVGFQLRQNSLAYENGASVTGNGGLDYFGNALSVAYNVGADETSPPWSSLWYVDSPSASVDIVKAGDGTSLINGIEEPAGGVESLALAYDTGSNSVRLAEFDLDITSDRDLAGVNVEYDSIYGSVLVEGLTGEAGFVGSSYDLLIEVNDEAEVIGVCPGASSLAGLSTDCGGYYELDVESDVSQETIDNNTYYRIPGVTGTAVFYPEVLGLTDTGSGIVMQVIIGIAIIKTPIILYRRRRIYSI